MTETKPLLDAFKLTGVSKLREFHVSQTHYNLGLTKVIYSIRRPSTEKKENAAVQIKRSCLMGWETHDQLDDENKLWDQ
jgi:hypothetical protein